MNVAVLSQEPEAILNAIAGALLCPGSNLMLFTAEVLVVIGPVHATHVARDGHTKDSIREYLWERGTIELVDQPSTDLKATREWKATCHYTENGREYLRPTPTPQDIKIICAGGLSGPHSAILQPFNHTKLVSVAVE
jgi:hypothetical protein